MHKSRSYVISGGPQRKLLLRGNQGGNMEKLKVKVSQSYLTIWDPINACSPWNFPSQNIGVGRLSLLQGIFPNQRLNPALPHCRQILWQLNHKGSPRILEWVACPSFSRFFQPQNPALQEDSLPTELLGIADRKPLLQVNHDGNMNVTLLVETEKKSKIWLCERSTTLRCGSLNPHCSVQQNTLVTFYKYVHQMFWLSILGGPMLM